MRQLRLDGGAGYRGKAMTSHYVAFDLEIAKDIPSGTADWRAIKPLGITCAATYVGDGATRLWYPQLDGDDPDSLIYRLQMSPEECQALALYLIEMSRDGYEIVTWNGLGFDFEVLAEECQALEWFDNVADLALHHIDVFFAMHCAKGFGIGLEAACKGMNIAGKLDGMSGAKAPQMWREGYESQRKVLEYVSQDARITGRVYEEITKTGKLDWIARSGRANTWLIMNQKQLLTVYEALQSPLPDTSWMTNPRPRSAFSGWAQNAIKETNDS